MQNITELDTLFGEMFCLRNLNEKNTIKRLYGASMKRMYTQEKENIIKYILIKQFKERNLRQYRALDTFFMNLQNNGYNCKEKIDHKKQKRYLFSKEILKK